MFYKDLLNKFDVEIRIVCGFHLFIAFELFAKLTLGVPAYAVGQGKMRKIRTLLRFTNSASKFIQPHKGVLLTQHPLCYGIISL